MHVAHRGRWQARRRRDAARRRDHDDGITTDRSAGNARDVRGGWCGGWWRGATWLPSSNHNARPDGVAVDLVVVHSISLPPGRYGGDAVQRLFANRLDPAAHPYFEALRDLKVSSHFYIRRGGRTLQFVDVRRRAWHAGLSRWRGRDGCNDVSVGIELEGLEGRTFRRAQYRALAVLIRQLAARHRLVDVVGHEHVAPGRKGDPGAGFDWTTLARRLRGLGLAVGPAAVAASTLHAAAMAPDASSQLTPPTATDVPAAP